MNQKSKNGQIKKKNIKIQFGYTPENPIIDTFTGLQFSIQDLETGEHIKDFDARVVVTNGQRLFKFEILLLQMEIFL